jgi:hypothetical protein
VESSTNNLLQLADADDKDLMVDQGYDCEEDEDYEDDYEIEAKAGIHGSRFPTDISPTINKNVSHLQPQSYLVS